MHGCESEGKIGFTNYLKNEDEKNLELMDF